MRHRFLIIVGALVVIGAVAAGALYYAYPVQVSTFAGLTRNYLISWSAPPGTTTTELNAAYQGAGAAAPSPPAEAPSAGAAAGDWPSYNRTLTSERYSPLSQINTKNAGKLKVLCTYDVDQFAAFEPGLIKVDNALIGTTEFDIFSLDPATCAENWRTHENYPPSLLPSNRGAAYMDGMLFRGTQDGRVLAYDFKTGRRIWEATIADAKLGESVPSAPIAWDGLVFVGNAGGDFKGGKGRMYALDAKTGKIVWEFFLVPKAEGEATRGPQGATPLNMSTWKNAPGIPISGGGTWTSYTLDAKTGLLYVPGGNPAPDFAIAAREGENLYTDSVVVLDAKTGDYKHHFKIVPKDWHDWDVSNPPVLIRTMGGKQLMSVAPKDGQLYGFDLANNESALPRAGDPGRGRCAQLSRPAKLSISARAAWGAGNGTARPTFRRRTSSSWARSSGATRQRRRMSMNCGLWRSGSRGPGWRHGTRSGCSAEWAARRDTGLAGSTPSTPTPASGSGA